ncbi:MAG: hypothetical protein ABSA11_03325 [Candidatus Bathyarchaeia archaeon]
MALIPELVDPRAYIMKMLLMTHAEAETTTIPRTLGSLFIPPLARRRNGAIINVEKNSLCQR